MNKNAALIACTQLRNELATLYGRFKNSKK